METCREHVVPVFLEWRLGRDLETSQVRVPLSSSNSLTDHFFVTFLVNRSHDVSDTIQLRLCQFYVSCVSLDESVTAFSHLCI